MADLKNLNVSVSTRNTSANHIIHSLIFCIFLIPLFIISQYNALFFHTIIEIASIVVAWSLFIIVWNTRELHKNDAFVFLGISFLCIGALDIFHTLSFKGIGGLEFQLGAHLSTQMWTIARYIESLSFCLFSFLLGKRINLSLTMWSYAILTALVFSSLLYSNLNPGQDIESIGIFIFKKNSAYIISLFFIAALFFLSKRKNLLSQTVYNHLAASIVLAIPGELILTFCTGVYGLANFIGHLFKILSFFLIYRAFIHSGLRNPYDTIFHELKTSEEKLKCIFRAAPIGAGLVINRVINDVNDCFCEILGYSKNELIGQNARIAYPSDEEFERVGREEYRLIREKGTGTIETKMQTKDGKKINALLSSSPIDLTNISKGVIFTALDITEQKKKELALLESEEKHRSIMEAMDDMAYICSPDYLIEYVNPVMEKSVGCEAVGRQCNKSIFGRDERCPWCIHEKIMDGEKVQYELVSPKDHKNYHISSSPIFHLDGTVSMLTIFRDITDFKKMESQLRQTQKMEAIGTLAGGIAHDFNNILFPIVGHAEMLLEDTVDNTPQKESLNEIYTSALRAKDLVQQILSFSRQGQGKPKMIRMQSIIKEVLKLIRSTIPANISIRQDLQSDCRAVKADPTQIHQIVMNLTTNAYHAMEENGGEMNVTLREIQLNREDLFDPEMTPGSYAFLKVTDTGIGMDKALAEKIFDPFFTTKEHGKGTGMGLSVVHGIVKKMKGGIRVYSEPGKGTVFDIYLPVIKGNFEVRQTLSATPLQRGSERILLVDDEKGIVMTEKRALERLGYHVVSRTSSLEALEAFKSNPDKFDLVITDMAMPNMQGDKLAVELINIRPSIPILLCTGFSESMTEEKIKSLGIKALLLKPIIISELAQKVRKVLDDAKKSV